ncbi:pyruvate kinase [Camelimonas abortus]|uniref:Pyruvate kinase n=1 Tax=Camelimonas abortus TaxID=1017184 RepID=A0ABV7LH75_9HYPH
MRRMRRVKVVATLGPASSTPGRIEALFRAGADMFRINMSHTSREALRQRVADIRAVEAAVGRPIGVLADLQGPKLRLGVFAGGRAILESGARFVLDGDETPGSATRAQLPHPEILRALEPGHRVLVDDGKVELKVTQTRRRGRNIAVETTVVVPGAVSDRKGVSLPDTTIPVSAMTAKDRSDLEAALDCGVDWIAVSFVQRPEDVADVRKVAAGRALVMAKIEKPQAVARLEEIFDVADGVMVARGDLGVEMPLEQVPGIQKLITRMGRRLGKPVVIATQMLESMISSPVPTRAEVSDVATAVFEGADAVMLSAESAAGQFPVEAVATMDRIGVQVESDANFRAIINAQRSAPESTGADAIAAAARTIAETVDIRTIVAWTASGATGLRISRERPQTPMIALTPRQATARRLAVAWGIHAVVTEDAHDVDDMTERACRIAAAEGFAKPAERVLIVAGVPFGSPGATNLLRMAFISSTGAGGA